jgi:hypothetical protein
MPPEATGSGLRRPLPRDRTLDEVRRHYEVERGLAERLKRASRDERKAIYATMYEELFRAVPDHPRLRRRDHVDRSAALTRTKLAMLAGFLDASKVFLEFAPGDCHLVSAAAGRVAQAYGVDISDQRSPEMAAAAGFQLIVYDGYALDGIPAGSVDVVFSDQLIEHLHPEDTRLHFELAFRLLKREGMYLFRTPHALSGPHDVSMYFSDVAEGFHLKEWSYRELRGLLADVGFRRYLPHLGARGTLVRLPYAYFAASEAVLQALPRGIARRAASVLLPTICVAAVK